MKYSYGTDYRPPNADGMLNVLVGLARVTNQDLDRQASYRLSEPSLWRVWGNDLDAAYDSYQALYDLLNE